MPSTLPDSSRVAAPPVGSPARFRLRSWLPWAAFLILVAAAFPIRVEQAMIDFEVDYRAGRRLRSGEDLYRVSDGHYMYKYFPATAMIEAPFSLLPPRPAKALFYLATVGAMVAILRLGRRMLPADGDRRAWVTIVTALVLAKCFVREIGLGQINLFMILLMMIAADRLRGPAGRQPRRDWTAGAAWALAVVLKPYALVYLPYLVVTRRWRALSAGLLVFGIAAIAPAAIYGWEGSIAQHRALVETLAQSSPRLLAIDDNMSVTAMLIRFGASPELAAWLLAALMVPLSLATWDMVRRGRELPDPAVLDCAVLLLLIPLLAPLGWYYLYEAAALGVMLLISQRRRFPAGWRRLMIGNLWILGISVSAVIGHPIHRLYTAGSMMTLGFLVLLVFLFALRFRRVC